MFGFSWRQIALGLFVCRFQGHAEIPMASVLPMQVSQCTRCGTWWYR